MLAEWNWANDTHALALETLYFGGGTPTFLSTAALERLLLGIRDSLDGDAVVEWTMEANPMTFDRQKAEVMREAGVTRVSLGVQSWQPSLLKILGRDHTPTQAEMSFRLLQEVGFPVVSIDLMFSLPGQSLALWEDDLRHTLVLQPNHLSAYNLTYEEDTPFFDQLGQGAFRDNADANADHFYRADALLSAAGYHHYEISNYALPGWESHHNRAYWKGRDYLGLGPSAVSTVQGKRWRNVPDTALYVQRVAQDVTQCHVDWETLSETDRHNERIALQLRTLEGIRMDDLASEARERAKILEDEGVLECQDAHWRLTKDHRALVDPVAAELFV